MNPPTQQMITMVVTTVMGTLIGWLLNGLRTRTEKLHEKTDQECREREQNREIIGVILFYMLEDMHRRFVVEKHTCSATDKQQVDDIYHHYHDDLGLNGPGTHMYNEIMEVHQG